MRRTVIAGAVLLGAFAITGTARAEFGAVALDTDSGKYGLSWNQPDQKKADELAMRDCASSGCKVVFRLGPKHCGALATTENNKIWGGADREARPAAELAAIQNCQKRTSEQCKVRGSECNR